MTKTFQRAEAVICSITVKDTSDVLRDPATSMKIDITGPTGASVVAAAAMTKDSTGTYHYDYVPAAGAAFGIYKIKYTATDGTRLTIETDTFVLE
jgi:uncharacterized protein YfaS (alpha-2-macroglobulin family)